MNLEATCIAVPPGTLRTFPGHRRGAPSPEPTAFDAEMAAIARWATLTAIEAARRASVEPDFSLLVFETAVRAGWAERWLLLSGLARAAGASNPARRAGDLREVYARHRAWFDAADRRVDRACPEGRCSRGCDCQPIARAIVHARHGLQPAEPSLGRTEARLLLVTESLRRYCQQTYPRAFALAALAVLAEHAGDVPERAPDAIHSAPTCLLDTGAGG